MRNPVLPSRLFPWLVAAATICTLLKAAASQPPNLFDYFPSNPGYFSIHQTQQDEREKQYTVFDSGTGQWLLRPNNGQESDTYGGRYTILANRSADGACSADIDMLVERTHLGEENSVEKCRLSEQEVQIGGLVLLQSGEPWAGRSWPIRGHLSRLDLDVFGTATVLADHVAVGRFKDCVQVDYTLFGQRGQTELQEQTSRWYARGFGLVRACPLAGKHHEY